MRVLLLGLSRIARRRVLPALDRLQTVATVDVASRSSVTLDEVPERLRGALYSDYDEALLKCGGDIVYISLINSLHVPWALRALERGYHVIVDKPCAPTQESAEALVKLGRMKGRCLAEATVFSYHPQANRCADLARQAGPGGLRVSATFSFPPMNASDFRYSREAAGGSLQDLGPYVAATARMIFDRPPDYVACQVLSRTKEVDTAFAVMMKFPCGGVLVGRFGFDTEYCNHVSVLGTGISFELNRLYTILPEMENAITVRRNNVEERIIVPPADPFLVFLQQTLNAISSGNYEVFAQNLLSDAALSESLRRAALGN